jgi:hypothetical protein
VAAASVFTVFVNGCGSFGGLTKRKTASLVAIRHSASSLTESTSMHRSFSFWANTFSKLGFRKSAKQWRQDAGRRARLTRQPRIEQLEERLNFSSGMEFLYQIATIATSAPAISCNCSPAGLTISNGMKACAGQIGYNSITDPEASGSVHIKEPDRYVLNSDADNFRVDITIAGLTQSYYWKAGLDTTYDPNSLDEIDGVMSIDFDFGDLPTGVYN